MKRLLFTAFLGMAILDTGSGVALAHASLTRCSIHNYQVFKYGHAPKSITAYFAEDLDPKQSWMAVFEGQADHGLVTEGVHSKPNYQNPKELTLRLPKLGREKYYLIWYTHSAIDGHFAAGIVYFQVT